MYDFIRETLQQLQRAGTDPQLAQQEAFRAHFSWLASATREQVSELLVALDDALADGSIRPAEVFLALRMLQRFDVEHALPLGPDSIRVASIQRLYQALVSESGPRHHLLRMLAEAGDPLSLAVFADLMATDPPATAEAVVEAFTPLWRSAEAHYEALFPSLLGALQYPAVAVVVLDLANYLYQSERLPEHPLRPRAGQLTALLGQVVERLEGWEETCRVEGVPDLHAARQVADGIALAVSLTFALSLLEEREASGKLFRMMALPHRRLRVEAAAALARWEEPAGVEQLVELAAEPVVRLRTLAYADELGLLDQIDPAYCTESARAEAELVARLSEPQWFGVPPSCCKLVERRLTFWPGREGPVACFLFEYVYELPGGTLRNIGLAGPGVECLACDLTQLDREDQYAAFAGWRVEHAEIGREEIDANEQDAEQAEELSRFRRQLDEAGWELLEPAFLGRFFGERVLVATARKAAAPGCVVVATSDCFWYPRGDPRWPLRPEVAFAIYMGRRMLESFHSDPN